MIDEFNAPDLLNKKPLVRLFSGADYDDTVAIGQMVAYSSQPMVCVKLPDGQRKWWVAAIAEVVDQ